MPAMSKNKKQSIAASAARRAALPPGASQAIARLRERREMERTASVPRLGGGVAVAHNALCIFLSQQDRLAEAQRAVETAMERAAQLAERRGKEGKPISRDRLIAIATKGACGEIARIIQGLRGGGASPRCIF